MKVALKCLGIGAIFSLILIGSFATGSPQIQTVSLPKTIGESSVISGTNFGTFDGEIVSWDDFEKHPKGERLNGLMPIEGHKWGTIFDYNGYGIALDGTHTASGSGAVKIDWALDPADIRAFGWANKGPYKQLYITYWRYMTGNFVAGTSNHKQFYLYGNNNQMPQGMPLMPGGTSQWGFYNNVSTGPITLENKNPNNINNKGWNWSNTNNIMQRWEFFIKLNEPFTEKNGTIKAWLNGQKGIDNTNYQVRHSNGEFIDFRLGHMTGGFHLTAKAWFDDVYISTTQARIEICNSKVYEDCTIKQLQYVNASQWTDNKITFTLRNLKELKGADVYLYVIDNTGTPSNPILLPKPLPPTAL